MMRRQPTEGRGNLMARMRAIGVWPQVIGRARAMVRDGYSVPAVVDALREDYPHLTGRQLGRVAREAQEGIAAAERLYRANMTRRGNIAEIAGCGGASDRVRMRVEVHYYDQQRGRDVSYGHTVEAGGTRRLADQVTEAIVAVGEAAAAKNYEVPRITSSMRTGPAHYTISYVECL